eukprot:scaffold4247_cov174-Ochromonas_danica.AAC.29
MIVLRGSGPVKNERMNEKEANFLWKMEREGIFEIKEFIDDEGHETGSNEVVDITKELEFFEKLAKAHEMQQKAEASRQQQQQQQQTSSSSSAASSSLEPTNASLLASSSSSLPSDEADFIRELSLLADQSESHEREEGEGDIMDVLERLDRQQRSRQPQQSSGWKKGFLAADKGSKK